MSDFLAEMEARRARGAPRTAPVAAIVVVCLLGFVGSCTVGAVNSAGAARLLAGGGDAPTHYLTLAGSALALAAGLIGVLSLAGLWRRRPKWALPLAAGVAVIVLLLSFGFAASIGASVFRSAQEDLVRTEFAALMDRVLSDGPATAAIDTRPKAVGQYGKLERGIKEGFAEMQRLGATYQTDIKDLDLEWSSRAADFTPAALRARIDRLKRAKALTETYKAAMNRVVRGMPARLEALGLEPDFMDDFNRGFETTVDRNLDQLNRMADLQQRVLDLSIDQSRYLLDRPGRWQVQGGRILFVSATDMNRFNAMGHALNAANAEIASIRLDGRKDMAASRDRIARDPTTP